MLGLLFLLLAQAAYSLQLPLSLLSACGFFVVWKWKVRGFIASFLIIATSLIVFHEKEQLLFASSLVLSLLIMALSLQSSAEKEKQKWTAFHEELKMLQHVKEEESIASAETFFKETTALQDQIEQLTKALALKKQQLEESESFISTQREQLNKLRVEAYQLSLLVNYAPSEKIVEVVKVNPKDIQLRAQFEEKSQILHETRKALFLAENQLIALQKEQQLQASDPEDSALLTELIEQNEKCVLLEQEILELQEVISHLIAPKRVKSKKREILQPTFI